MKKTLTLLLLAGLTLEAQAETLTWNGDEDHMTWNTEDTNWLQGETSAKYTDGTEVVFGNTGSGTVTLADTFAPASVLVENNTGSDYTFTGEGTGDGKLTGEGTKLTKSGDGTLNIETANEYTGGTIINGGTLVMGNDKALGSGNVTLGSMGDAAATLDLNKHSISNQITLEGSASIGNGTLNGKVTMGSSAKITLMGDSLARAASPWAAEPQWTSTITLSLTP